MATEQSFQIKRGLSTNLMDENGFPKISLIEGCWYLTTDTAELYCAFNQGGILTLRKLNDVAESFDNLSERVSKLEEKETIQTFGYRSGFPTQGESGIIYIAVDEQKSYIWNIDNYMCVGNSTADSITLDVIFGGTAKDI